MAGPRPPFSLDELKRVIERQWGFRTFRPLQERAMRAVLEGRDSVVVLPTGGGKSLCYQAPAVLQGGTTVVVSPLISLMKDQVDSLQSCGVPAIQLDSSLSPAERTAYETDVRQGAVRLLFVSPERLVLTDFFQMLRSLEVRTFAIDEAHCISHWGHDFRPEYRQLKRIKELFPGASVHAYTATATERVRKDICTELGLDKPEVLVGNFDRPNLNYRVLPRLDLEKQVLEVLGRHKNEAGIIYCIRRADVDELAALLRKRGCNCLPYHAGLDSKQRRDAQDAFAAEKCDLIVATVAFGMGIDRSNIRFVLHTGMPKSVEHYQQETGRAGRDSLEAECVLLHSGADFGTWKWIIEKSVREGQASPEYLASSLKHLNDIDRYCRGMVCRHRALVNYFGQDYDVGNCAACDICLGDTELVPDAVVVAQKILSCVARVQERFGVNHVIGVLRGENTERIRQLKHEQLTTYGLLREVSKAELRDWIYQLLSQNVLVQDGDEYPILRLNDASWEVMKKEKEIRLRRTVRRQKDESAKKSKADTTSWEGVDRELFEELRLLRLKYAGERAVPPYIIFSDATLRELARTRPSTLERMRLIYGIGQQKLQDFGEPFLQRLLSYCKDHDLPLDQAAAPAIEEEPTKGASGLSRQRTIAFDEFRQGASIEEVMSQTGRTRNTVLQYLVEFIHREKPASIAKWIPDAVYQRVAPVARQVGMERLKPIFVTLNEEVSYDDIRLVVAHLKAVTR